MQSDTILIDRIREGEPKAWDELIARFEGRLTAFVESRVKNEASAEDLVQDVFVGFLTSLPNYDSTRPLESYLFSIAAHKLTDFLRRQGRRPTLPLAPRDSESSGWEPTSDARPASSIARSSERRHLEEDAVAIALRDQIDHWRKRSQWDKLKCAELLFVRGWANKQAAQFLNIPEQTIANYKFECLSKLRDSLRGQKLSEDVFPELHEGG